jgi:hypothetical protein
LTLRSNPQADSMDSRSAGDRAVVSGIGARDNSLSFVDTHRLYAPGPLTLRSNPQADSMDSRSAGDRAVVSGIGARDNSLSFVDTHRLYAPGPLTLRSNPQADSMDCRSCEASTSLSRPVGECWGSVDAVPFGRRAAACSDAAERRFDALSSTGTLPFACSTSVLRDEEPLEASPGDRASTVAAARLAGLTSAGMG